MPAICRGSRSTDETLLLSKSFDSPPPLQSSRFSPNSPSLKSITRRRATRGHRRTEEGCGGRARQTAAFNINRQATGKQNRCSMGVHKHGGGDTCVEEDKHRTMNAVGRNLNNQAATQRGARSGETPRI
ncbi:hypothetical protein SKAU_G00203080 [Synaphobranchus kaupii]|uniref:Uncharacterized protein n=1 Tax=Synaphobranchus kaupii TaxID=118154 RepID=A0A9Q1FFW1_SYNKA|nr:hypothetical protein SKAU_G00203080 [Synaphobranchus kaupii]